ncbi:MAG: antitoxin [Candidatus Aminicenantes bacterium]|nr:antitoxin [Candidatus Aminicenantes bacterium]NIM77843.1 antitoxin [Candidatus Aminicenantes bacterium]NIN17155.1 antitoxin [Candidatus Aminicenantes bacterium]NIN41048.1 antitoxin [Candidatus Aminicenantes bacterium]NIN83853.1 antitoxin [Candidatus Aminicenantes bacterium]
MLSVRGIYDGKRIKPIEKFDAPSNVEVIITFLDKKASAKSVDDKTKDLAELCGSWEDDRTAEEIIKEIYDSRTSSQREIDL